MSNTIKIKHGSTPPGEKDLMPYELGYANNVLYIGQEGGPIQLTNPNVLPAIKKEVEEEKEFYQVEEPTKFGTLIIGEESVGNEVPVSGIRGQLYFVVEGWSNG